MISSLKRLHGLVAYHDLEFSNGTLGDEVRALAEEIRRELMPHLIRRAAQTTELTTLSCSRTEKF